MNFYKHPGLFEFILAGTFALAYVAYLARIIWLAFVLKTRFRGVFVKILLRTSYVGLMLVALLAPSFGDIKKEIKSVGKDIYLLVDLSQSMNATDIEPSRLDKLKYELKNLVESFHSDRIGLIIFSSEAFVQCPLTYDQGALNLFIETLNTNLVPTGGTDFGPALEMALKRQQEAEEGANQAKSKIVVLISDGEDFGEDTKDIAEKLQDEGVKLFTLGIGTETGGKIPVAGGFKRDEDGKIVQSKLNPADLRKLANITGGKYYEISDNRNDTKKMIGDISKIEGELRDVKTIDTSANKYFYFLFAALVLIVFDVLITVHVIRI